MQIGIIRKLLKPKYSSSINLKFMFSTLLIDKDNNVSYFKKNTLGNP